MSSADLLSERHLHNVKAYALAEAMLNYGAASQLYFDYNADDPANAG